MNAGVNVWLTMHVNVVVGSQLDEHLLFWQIICIIPYVALYQLFVIWDGNKIRWRRWWWWYTPMLIQSMHKQLICYFKTFHTYIRNYIQCTFFSVSWCGVTIYLWNVYSDCESDSQFNICSLLRIAFLSCQYMFLCFMYVCKYCSVCLLCKFVFPCVFCCVLCVLAVVGFMFAMCYSCLK